MKPLRVVIADDSLFMRVALRRLLSQRPEFVVVGDASDGVQAVEMVVSLRPDVCTLDLNMPGKDGLSALKEIMARCPTPVVMFSAHTEAGMAETVACLSAGAVDFLPKPQGEVSADLSQIGDLLARKLVAAATARIPRGSSGAAASAPSSSPMLPAYKRSDPLSRPGLASNPGLSLRAPISKVSQRARIAVIALSTGGPELLSELVPRLKAQSIPILLVQHMPKGFTKALAERLDQLGALRVREAEEGDFPSRGQILLARGDRHLGVNTDGTLAVLEGPEVHGVRPAADITMAACARVYRSRTLGLVLTGMGQDGKAGLAAIRAAGGTTYAQDRGSCLVYGMPRAAIEAGVVDQIVSPLELPDLLSED